MHARTTLALALAIAMGAAPAFAAEDLQQLRQEIDQLRQSYETRLNALEARLKQAESTQATPAPSLPAAAPANRAAASHSFNPDIALILSGTYTNLSQDPADFAIDGFIPGGEEIGPGQRGFSLGESEISLSANIDPLFFGALTLAIADDGVSAEEAYVQTTALGEGLRLKFGRYFSAIGYLNEQHAHVWDFVDAPLAYQAFLGGQLADDGLQLKWLLPTSQFVEVGAEIGRGQGFPGSDRQTNGLGATRLFAHTGGDLGDSHNWRAGLAWLSTSPRERVFDATDLFDQSVSNAFSGTSRLWLADLVWKWAPHGNASRTSFKLQGEYFRRHESGQLTYDLDAVSAGSLTDSYDSKQSGGYVQAIYQFLPAWRVGLRHDLLDSGTTRMAGNAANLARVDYSPRKTSLMLDWTPSEFSRVRLQLADDQSRQGVNDRQLFLQYQMSLGAHGAHSY